ncbi:MAG: Aminopeptidase T [candidate division WS6 bacterium OLB20]|uniref:Aminopeptidase T n=1 Tax=candidate division WS6 bacterium OLB20 TaxID=1617426 RepID=A0A136LXS9_9BACT|nr:MAG: Aminopeptidase T [candidate division WS6 bacterium OLB20]
MQPTENDYRLAGILLDHSLEIKPKEHVLISVSEHISNGLIKAVFEETLKRGAYPLVDSLTNFYLNRASFDGLNYRLLNDGNDWQAGYVPETVLNSIVDWADAFVRITSVFNKKELSGVDERRITGRMKTVRPIFDKMVNSDRWVLTYYPTPAMAQAAGVSLSWLQEFYYSAVLVDYSRMKRELTGLEKILDAGSQIRIRGDRTDITLDITGRLAKAAYGERNIPDGEVFLAPVKNSAQGEIYFDLPTIYAGQEMRGITLTFENGKAVAARAEAGQKSLDRILSTDEGARFLGEFAIGANYRITQPLLDTLFDEKIGGTIHMALGRSYMEERGGAPHGGNESAIHWDIVKDMRLPGSVVEVDGTPVLKDGRLLV